MFVQKSEKKRKKVLVTERLSVFLASDNVEETKKEIVLNKLFNLDVNNGGVFLECLKLHIPKTGETGM